LAAAARADKAAKVSLPLPRPQALPATPSPREVQLPLARGGVSTTPDSTTEGQLLPWRKVLKRSAEDVEAHSSFRRFMRDNADLAASAGITAFNFDAWSLHQLGLLCVWRDRSPEEIRVHPSFKYWKERGDMGWLTTENCEAWFRQWEWQLG